MNKHDYLATLKLALTGLPPEAAAKTMAYYEQRFVDGVAAGRSETEVGTELDDPRKIAVTLRASTHLSSFEQKKDPATVLRMLISVVGLAIFNLFMLVPAMVYAAMLATLYAASLVFFLFGVGFTSSGLAGINAIVIDGPAKPFVIFDDERDDQDLQTKMTISEGGISVSSEPRTNASAAGAKATARAADGDANADEADTGKTHAGPARFIKKAEMAAGRALHFTNDSEVGSADAQTAVGIALVLVGIMLTLTSLVVTNYTLLGVRRYIEMNFSLLRGH